MQADGRGLDLLLDFPQHLLPGRTRATGEIEGRDPTSSTRIHTQTDRDRERGR